MKPSRKPVSLSSIVLQPTWQRRGSMQPKVEPIKFCQISQSEAIMLDKDGKVWRVGTSIRTAAHLSTAAHRVLIRWGIFTAADVKAYEAASADRNKARMIPIWRDELEKAATALGVKLTKAQQAKIASAA